MQIDWIWGLIGGGLIGTAGAMFLLVNGRIMGASGLIGGLVDGSAGNTKWERVAFLTGVVLMPILLRTLYPSGDPHLSDNLIVLAAAGLLVGVGTRLANGCTSGHGVCGMSRLSIRGFAATACYILAGGVSVLLFRHLLGVI
ncbi:hypothetical protein AL036_04095 [Salipiger aestuarii]|uniref:Uncharacterized protein n=1 Tax=Salipiger aestuarii TaxID=568098 RepID=A0A327YKK5_9RHOB|nr:YeeE/YedE thiosulfate transporter family protein [Salipiger aestuarii]KAA8609243.1 hypothetical protein AL036_04095 [Salipiger aestuarii]KAB2542852.1 hypothetical protein AL035_04360 [Salipiger aestuarii]RAK20766.1 hypothetical protein ATI53_100514 [Salipiger aestuarii]